MKWEPSPGQVVLSPAFLIGLALLILNDFYLKCAFGNMVTGKLSDFAGLFVFPMFFAALIPRWKVGIYLGTALAFLVWKTPLADPFIATLNEFSPLRMHRTVDYSDYLAISILPFSYYYLSIVQPSDRNVAGFKRAASCCVIMLSVFAFGATQFTKDRKLFLEDQFLVNERHDQITAILRSNGKLTDLRVRRDDEVFANFPNVEIDKRNYFYDFVLNEPTCDSKGTKMSFLIVEKDTYTELRGLHVEFECKEYQGANNYNALDKAYVGKVERLFLEHVIGKLTPSNNK